jgi:hypothetical protein
VATSAPQRNSPTGHCLEVKTIKAHKWAQPVNPLLTPLTVHVSPPAALEGEAAGEARGRSGRARLKARRNADTAEQQRLREGPGTMKQPAATSIKGRNDILAVPVCE